MTDPVLESVLALMGPDDKAEVFAILEEIERRKHAQECRDDFLKFVCHMNPEYIVGAHHKRLASLLEDMAYDRLDRIAVSIPPRHGKSELISVFFPAWFLGKFPDKNVIMASHTGDLSVDFGRKVRNIVDSDKYKIVFPNVALAADSKSAGRWNTNGGGSYFAVGVGAALAGRGADIALVDDPISEQGLIAGNFDTLQKVYDWYTYGLRTRLMKGGRIALVHTRWHPSDLIGRVVKDAAMNPLADQYRVFEFPAILNEDTPRELALWPEMFPLDVLKRTRASMPAFQWKAQYQQQPVSEEGALVQRSWFKTWTKTEPPKCSYIIMVLDAAQEAKERADYSAISIWGVFYNEEVGSDRSEIILLDAVRDRVDFPSLKALALRKYKEYEPDSFLIEKKSSGVALFQELRRMGLSVSEFTPHRGTGDKTARLNGVSDMIKDGLVWVPETRWAEELVDEVVSYPTSSNDDFLDTMVMALARFRQGALVQVSTDQKDEPSYFKGNRRGGYY